MGKPGRAWVSEWFGAGVHGWVHGLGDVMMLWVFKIPIPSQRYNTHWNYTILLLKDESSFSILGLIKTGFRLV